MKAVIVRQVRKPTVETKGPGARDGERSFSRHPQQLVHDLRIKGPGARDGERSFGCQPSDSFTTSGEIKGQGPGLVDVLLQPTEH